MMKDNQLLKNKKLFLLDMDGTIYLDNNLFEHSLDFLNYIKQIKGKYIFLTNNSSKSVDDYIDKLEKMSIEVDYSNFMTSSQATAFFLKEKYHERKIYVLGTESFKQELNKNELNIVDKIEDNISCMVVGYDTELSYSKLIDACQLLSSGVDFIATNPDLVCPTSFGFIPDCGSICNMLIASTGKLPHYIGKPSPTMVHMAMNTTSFTSEETIMIGDRLYTDIACGINAGVDTGVVLTGETKENDLVNTKFEPTFVFNTISELYKLISCYK